jgi:hypothetical protein
MNIALAAADQWVPDNGTTLPRRQDDTMPVVRREGMHAEELRKDPVKLLCWMCAITALVLLAVL